jgi:hypothetical protein
MLWCLQKDMKEVRSGTVCKRAGLPDANVGCGVAVALLFLPLLGERLGFGQY